MMSQKTNPLDWSSARKAAWRGGGERGREGEGRGEGEGRNKEDLQYSRHGKYRMSIYGIALAATQQLQ